MFEYTPCYHHHPLSSSSITMLRLFLTCHIGDVIDLDSFLVNHPLTMSSKGQRVDRFFSPDPACPVFVRFLARFTSVLLWFHFVHFLLLKKIRLFIFIYLNGKFLTTQNTSLFIQISQRGLFQFIQHFKLFKTGARSVEYVAKI